MIWDIQEAYHIRRRIGGRWFQYGTIEINEKAVERLKRKIILQENQNLKTRAMTDQQMVAWIKQIGRSAMLLESITLENFRQFRHESIDFAQGDNGKNVTIIIGENGTGKTTFAQAFFWCMYGETEFSDKNMLNKLVAAEMKPGQESKVQVILKLRHGTVNYTLMREQTYRKDYSNRVKDNTVFDIAQRRKWQYILCQKSQCKEERNPPKELIFLL